MIKAKIICDECKKEKELQIINQLKHDFAVFFKEVDWNPFKENKHLCENCSRKNYP